MNIKKFLLKSLFILLPIIVVWAFAFFRPMDILDYDYALWMQQKEYIENQKDYNETVILGDSSAQFNIQLENGWDDAHMLAVGAMRVPGLYYSLQNYLKNHPAPKNVILSISYDRFYGEYDEFLVKGVGYHYLSWEEVQEIRDTAKNTGSRLLEKATFYEMFRYYYRTPDLYALEIFRNLTEHAGRRNKEIFEKTTARRGSYSYSAPEYALTQLTKTAVDKKIFMDPLMSSYLDRIIELCNEKDIRLIMVQAPMNKASCDSLDEQWFADFEQMMAPYEGRLIMEKEIPVYSNEFFYSSNHMNQKGISVYTEDLRKKVESELNGGGF